MRRILLSIFIPGFLCLAPAILSADGIYRALYIAAKDWAETDKALLRYFETADSGAQEMLLEAVENFRIRVKEFSGAAYQGKLKNTAFLPSNILQDITVRAESLPAAIRARQRQEILRLTTDIRGLLTQWQHFNADLANRIAMNYFYQFLLLTLGIIILSLFLWRSYRALSLSRAKEKHSAAFSRDFILAQEWERSRISRDLHDTVAQDLRCLGMRLSGCIRASDSGSLITVCREVLQKQNDILAQVKTICNNLVPPDFRQLGLVGALRVLCGEFSGKNAIECRVSVQENLDIETLGIENQLQCYRLVQESLSNIAKHSGATEAVVVLRKAASQKPSLLICVSDDGKGFAQPPSQYDGAAGMGIRGMYERISILGGELSFLTIPGEGAMVRIEIPLPEPGNQEL